MANRRTSGRIVIPRNPQELMELALAIYTKHQADGATSPLNNLDGQDWTVSGTKIATAQTKHTEAEEHKRKSEEAYRERDIYLNELEKIVKTSAQLLKAFNSSNPKRLSDWGFTVDDSPRTK
ncbi:MAG: hypothetical protein ACRCSB_01915 [Bacteroidales bacterium]